MAASARLKQLSQQIAPPTPSVVSRVDDHVVIITGAAQGIGKSAALLLAQHGAKLVLSDIDEDKLKDTAAELTSAGYETHCFAGDVLDEQFPAKLVESALTRFGKINCLINNAGFCYDSAIHKMTDAKFDLIIRVHNHAPFRLVRALSRYWMDKENLQMPKCVINVSSTSGLHGSPGQVNYATAKAGIVGLTKTIASEWGRFNVRANAIAYGWIDTRITRPPDENMSLVVEGERVIPGIPLNAKKWRDMSDIPLGRVGTAEEAARVMLFLASPLAAYVTGACIECTGGRFL